MILTWVSVSMRLVATSNLFGLERYLFCLNCFSNSKSCCEVKAVLGLLVFPSSACPGPQPEAIKKFSLICYFTLVSLLHSANPFYLRTITNETAFNKSNCIIHSPYMLIACKNIGISVIGFYIQSHWMHLKRGLFSFLLLYCFCSGKKRSILATTFLFPKIHR